MAKQKENLENKNSKFQAALDKLNKTYGVGTILALDSKSNNDYDVISTGSIGFDYVTLGVGGFVKGKMYELMGWEGCLAEDTYIKFINVRHDGIVQDCKGGTIKNLYERFHNRTDLTKNTTFNVTSINEEDKIFRNEIANVVKSGVKECFELITKKGFKIKATKDHKFYTGNNYVSLENLSIGDVIFVHTNTPYTNDEVVPRKKYKETTLKYYYKGKQKEINGSFYYKEKVHRLTYEANMNNLTYKEYIIMLNSFSTLEMLPLNLWTIPEGYEIHHIDENTHNNDIDNLELIAPSDHAKLHALDRHNNLRFIVMPDEIIDITSVGEIETYDIKCYFPYNNFIAEGIVVHNSGKSTICGHVAAECQKKGGTVLYIDGEHAVDKQYFQQLGVDTTKMLIAQPSCIWENEYILTPEGNKQLSSITELNELVSINSNNNASTFNYPTNILTSNKKGVYIKTGKGSIITSKDHKIKTFTGFKKAEELNKETDKIETLYKHNLFSRNNLTELNPNRSFILGAFIGDGNYNRSSVRFVGIDNKLNNFLLSIILKEFPDTTYVQKGKNISFKKKDDNGKRGKSSLKLFLNEHLGEVVKQNKVIPKDVFYSGEENLKSFLAGLIMTDGTVGKLSTITFTSYIKKMILDVSSILTFFAVPHTINTRTKNTTTGIKVWYNINVSTKEGVKFFKEEVPLLSYKKIKVDTLKDGKSFVRFPKDVWKIIFDEIRMKHATITNFSNIFFSCNRNKHLFNTKRGVSNEYLIKINSILCSKKIDDIINSDVTYTNINELNFLNDEYPMRDMTIPTTHNFIANNLVVHNCGEEGFNVAMEMINTGDIDLIIIDSDSSLIPKKMLDGEVGDSTIGRKALLNSNAYPKLKSALSQHNVCVIVISQYREKIGIMFGNPTTTQGGHALKFYTDCRIEVSRSLAKDGDVTYGNITKVKATKNKMSPPYRISQFDIVYGQGIDKLGELLQLLNDFEIAKKWGKSITVDEVKYDVDEFKTLILDNPEFYEELKQKIINKIKNTTDLPIEEVIIEINTIDEL